MIKALGYTRVSSAEQANEGISLQNQREKIQAYCALHEMELVELIEDAGKSGKDLNREGLQDILSQLAKVDAVVVYKLDRLSRKVLDTLGMIEIFEKEKVIFHSITEKIDTDTAMGRFFLNITASFAQMERDLISERTRDALQSKIQRGERAGQIPYGFRLGEDGNKLVEHPVEQKTIELIKELREQGFSLRKICKALTRKGLEPQGQGWHPQTIKNILDRVA